MTTHLYHGTSETVWRKIQAAGAILPRNATGASNWDHSVKSRHDAVYLTDTYAPYFAVNTITDADMQGADARVAIIEIAVAPIMANLVPDEDAIEQQTRPKGVKISNAVMIKRTRQIKASLHQYINDGGAGWRASLAYIGNCAHLGPIPLSAVTRVALIGIRSNPFWAMEAMNPMISRMNFVYCGARYRDHLMQSFTLGEVINPNEEPS